MKNPLQIAGLTVVMMFAQAAAAADGPAAPRETDLSLGVIQRAIKVGMSSTEVMEAAGSPNLVTRTKGGRESWVYDRFATETADKGWHIGGGGTGALSGGGGGVLGGLGFGGGRSKKTTSQRTLMVVVTFGPDGMVENFTYRSSRF